MNSPRTDAIRLIQHDADLQPLINELVRARKLAVDTESNSLYVYKEQVCLIQFSTETEDFLLDPLALKNLSKLAPVLNNPGIEKIFHAAEYDLLCLRRDFNFEVRNLFDTMVAARILGQSEVGLGALLEAEFGVHVEKKFQRANWGQRPLPEDLLDYARMDTHYLIALRDLLKDRLEARGLLALAREDFQRLSINSLGENGHSNGAGRAVSCWRISGSFDLTPQQAAVLQALCEYRDQMARQMNRPLFKVISDKTLLAIGENQPRSLDDLSRLPGMSAGQMRRHGQNLLRAVERGCAALPIYPPRSPRLHPAAAERLDALKNWRKMTAQQMGVPSDVVLPRDLMNSLAHGDPRSWQDLAVLMRSVPWRLEHFGKQILRTLQRH